jgi:hypothetical protein
MNRIHIALLSALTIFSVSTHVIAEPEEGWKETLKGELIKQVCHHDGAWLDCFFLKPQDCSKIITPLMNSCLPKYADAFLKAANDDQTAQNLGRIGNCIDQEFFARHGTQRKGTAECVRPPGL